MAMAKRKARTTPVPVSSNGVVRLEATHNLGGPGRFKFKIGLNEFDADEFAEMFAEIQKTDPDGVQRQLLSFERLFSDGLLRLAPEPEPESAPAAPSADGNKDAPQGVPGDKAAALALVKSSKDSAQLEAWFLVEKRAAVSDALVDRLKELDANK